MASRRPRSMTRSANRAGISPVPDTDPELRGGYPLTEEQANQIVSVPPGFTYVLEADR
jgi:hypothetical protein